MSRRIRMAGLVLASALALAATGCAAGNPAPPAQTGGPAPSPEGVEMVTVTDQWGREVEVPVSPDRVVVLEWEGLIAKTLQILGESETIVGADPNTLQPFRQTVVPALADAVNIGSPWSGLNYESMAALDPQVVFLEAWANNDENTKMHQGIIDQIEDLGIPVVAMKSPSNFAEPTLDRSWEIVDLVGAVYGRSADAGAVIGLVEAGIKEVTDRLPDLSEAERPEAAIFATTNYLMSTQSVQSTLLTEVLGARNVAAGQGTFLPVSEEQLLALDPAALVVIGHEGYLGVDQIRAGEQIGLNWASLQELSALKSGRVVALGYDEWRPTIETPIAMMKIASMLYPEQFSDVDVAERELRFYREVYGLDEAGARKAIADQHWTPEKGA